MLIAHFMAKTCPTSEQAARLLGIPLESIIESPKPFLEGVNMGYTVCFNAPKGRVPENFDPTGCLVNIFGGPPSAKPNGLTLQ